MLTFSKKIKTENNNAIVLVKGLKQGGKDSYAYMEMNKSQIECLNRDSSKGMEIILSQYGKVLGEGYGKKPNSQVRKRMKAQYGFRD